MRKTLTALLALAISATTVAAQPYAPVLGKAAVLTTDPATGLAKFNGRVSGMGPLLQDGLYKFYCVDEPHWEPWAALPTDAPTDDYFATAFTTNATTPGNGDFTKTRVNDETLYQKAAWLIETFEKGGMGAEWTAFNVQGTIWSMMGFVTIPPVWDLETYIPNNFASSLSYEWFVVSDDNRCLEAVQGQCVRVEESNQEFLVSRRVATVVPEPSTYALMAAGLAGLAMASRRRRRLS